MTSPPASFESLKKISRQFPQTFEMFEMIALLSRRGSERALGITASALLERALEEYVSSSLTWPSDEKEAEREAKGIFQGEGPLATFSAKIKMGYLLGLYGKTVRDDLDAIRNIRNAFAHSTVHIDFTTPAVAASCARLKSHSSIFPIRADVPEFSRAAFSILSLALTGLFLQAATDQELRQKMPELAETWSLETGFPEKSGS